MNLGKAPTWPPRAQPPKSEAVALFKIANQRQAQGIADDLAEDLTALATWARPTLARAARKLLTDILKGTDLVKPDNRMIYLGLWREALEGPPVLSANPTMWEGYVKDTIDDGIATLQDSGEVIGKTVVATAAFSVFATLLYLAARD